MSLKTFIKKLLYKEKASSDTYISYLRKKGMRIGDRVSIYAPQTNIIDETRPWLIEIGDDVKITAGVTILTHGYDWSVLAGIHNEVLGSAGKVKIGNNVFIGMHTTILKGVTIGNNVIIGANSLVNNDIPDNVVVAGNPAKVITTVDDYYNKRKLAQKQEAIDLYKNYVEVYNKQPPKEVYNEFFWLFESGKEELPDCFLKQMSHHEKLDENLKNLRSRRPEFNGYEEFLVWLNNQTNNNKN